MTKELSVFIIWSNGQYLTEPILADLKQNLKIIKIFEYVWKKEEFVFHLMQFYHKNFFRSLKKKKECGTGHFLVIVAEDEIPKYQDGINVHIMKLKYKYRHWCHGGYLIHASDNQDECKANLTYLFGVSGAEFLQKFEDEGSDNPIIYHQKLRPESRWMKYFSRLWHF